MCEMLVRKYLIPFSVVMFGIILSAPVTAEDTANHQEWNFTAILDGDPIGNHIFELDEVAGSKDQLKITSKADFVIGLIGIPFFHYHHVAHEQWSGGCLSHLTVDTNHDGDISHVTAQATADGGTIKVTNGSPDDVGKQETWKGCLMNFAYWNPKMREQTRLLDPETGEIEPVTIKQEADVIIPVHGQSVHAHVWRVTVSQSTGDILSVDVLYDDKDNWVGLDSKVRGGRSLSYRLP